MLRRASRRRPRSNRFDASRSCWSVSIKPARSVSRRHQHSKPQRRSSPTRRRGMPPSERRGSPVSKSKKPSNNAGDPLRSGSPSRQSSRTTQGVPVRISSRGRGALDRPPRRLRWSRGNAPARGAGRRSPRGAGRSRGVTRSLRAGDGRSGCAGACCGRGEPPRRRPRGRRRGGRGSSGMPHKCGRRER